MTGICYFANDEVEYFAEQQVNTIVNDIDDNSAETELTEDIAEEENGQLTFNF